MDTLTFDADALPWPLSHDFGLQAKWDKLIEPYTDFQLYCLTFPILVIGYTLGCLPYILLDLSRLPFFEKYKLQPGVYNPKMSIWTCYKDVQYIMWSVIGPLQLLSFPFFTVSACNCSQQLNQMTSWSITRGFTPGSSGFDLY